MPQIAKSKRKPARRAAAKAPKSRTATAKAGTKTKKGAAGNAGRTRAMRGIAAAGVTAPEYGIVIGNSPEAVAATAIQLQLQFKPADIKQFENVSTDYNTYPRSGEIDARTPGWILLAPYL